MDRIHLELPASTRFLNVLGACIAEMLERGEGLRERKTWAYAVQLAVHEVCVNIVEHAYRGAEDQRIEVVLTLGRQQFAVDLLDTGQPFAVDEMPLPDLNQPQDGGYGLYLARQLMDEVTYCTEAGRNHWHLAKQWTQEDK